MKDPGGCANTPGAWPDWMEPDMAKPTCSNPECEKPSQSRGLCRTHYMRWWRSAEGKAAAKPMGRPLSAPKPCEVRSCDRFAVTLGLCDMHYRRKHRTGKAEGLSTEDMFFRHVTENAAGCWEFDCVGGNGYGLFQSDKVSYLAHRWCYELMVAPIPPGLTIDHLCRNRACVNPDHLDPVPIEVNIRRAVEHRHG